MHALLHEFACDIPLRFGDITPELARFHALNATASKSIPEAGRRGGESTARQSAFTHLFSQPERVAVPHGLPD